MKYFFPPQNQNFRYLQTNRSDGLGSIWASFNLDFQSKLATMKLAQKLVTNTTSSDDADLGLPVAFDFFFNKWWSICGTRIFKNDSPLITAAFTEESGTYQMPGDSTTQFDITNPTGTTYRYTYDGTGTDPLITALTFPIGDVLEIVVDNFNVANTGTFTITGSGANYFEITNASGVAETNKTLGAGYIKISGTTTIGKQYSTLYSDLAVFNDILWATDNVNLWYKTQDTVGSANTWWHHADTLATSIMHKMVYFKKFNRLYYISGANNIRSIDENYIVASSGDYTLDPTKSIGKPSTMVVNSSSIWIGGYAYSGSSTPTDSRLHGTISQWDGISNQIINEYVIEAAGVLAMCVLNDIPYAIDTEGRILKYTGYSFSEIARLPIDKQLLINSTTTSTDKFIHPNGFIGTKNNTLQILVNNLNEDANSTINENFPSGIWELDLETYNLTHRYSPTLKALSSATVTDFGQNRVSVVGALKENTLQSDSNLGRSSLIAGINYYTDATTIKSGIFIDSPYKPDTDKEGQKRGYFVTTQFESYQITDTWLRLWAIYKRFANATDKLIFKYRLEEEDPIQATITWISTTTFSTTTDISDYLNFEAEIIQGAGSGACTNIIDITENAGTYTATIDAAISGVTGTAKARFQKWIKLGEISNTVLSYGELPIDVPDVKIQIKGILEWTGDGEFAKMIINSKEDINIDS